MHTRPSAAHPSSISTSQVKSIAGAAGVVWLSGLGGLGRRRDASMIRLCQYDTSDTPVWYNCVSMIRLIRLRQNDTICKGDTMRLRYLVTGSCTRANMTPLCHESISSVNSKSLRISRGGLAARASSAYLSAGIERESISAVCRGACWAITQSVCGIKGVRDKTHVSHNTCRGVCPEARVS